MADKFIGIITPKPQNIGTSHFIYKYVLLKNEMHKSDTIRNTLLINSIHKGAQWLSGRVLDSRPKGRGFEPHRRHCVVVLEQDTFILA